MWKHFQHVRSMKGGRIQRLLVSVPLSVAVWALPIVCVCVYVFALSSDRKWRQHNVDITGCTHTQDLFNHFLTAKWYVSRAVSLRWCDGQGEIRALGRGGRQTGRQAAHQQCLKSLVCAGMGMQPKTISRGSGSRAPSSHQSSRSLWAECSCPWAVGLFH